MPELPEVETIVRYLRPKIRGKHILEMEAKSKRVLRYHKNLGEIKKRILGKKISDIRRLGKNIVFKLNDGTCFVVHLMMTGKLLLNPQESKPHDRLLIKLSGGTKLVFNDTRQFGWCRVIESSEKLAGPDALVTKFKDFKRLINIHKSAIKNLFLNQKIISGIGNIYSDEILWHAGINPKRKADSLREAETRKLYQAMRRVLERAIKKEGTSSRDYRKPDGSKGGYYEIRRAYQRRGEICTRCGGTIRRTTIGQRSAHFCPKHQR